jgi:anti-sigma factor RsiW
MKSHLPTEIIVDYLHGELRPEADALALAHIEACAECRGELEREAALTQVLRAAASAEETEMPSLVAARVWEAIRTAKPTPFQRWAALLRPAIAVPIAAALLIGGFFASPLSRGTAAPRINASYYLETHAAQQADNPFAEHGTGGQLLETISYEDVGSLPALAGSPLEGIAANDTFDAAR